MVWKGVFGFDKGVEKDITPTGKGKSMIEHCASIVKVLFTTSEKDSEYMNAGPLEGCSEKLSDVVSYFLFFYWTNSLCI